MVNIYIYWGAHHKYKLCNVLRTPGCKWGWCSSMNPIEPGTSGTGKTQNTNPRPDLHPGVERNEKSRVGSNLLKGLVFIYLTNYWILSARLRMRWMRLRTLAPWRNGISRNGFWRHPGIIFARLPAWRAIPWKVNNLSFAPLHVCK